MQGAIERHIRQQDTACTITRRTQTGTNDLGEPLYDDTTVATNVACAFVDQGTSFERLDGGDFVQRPAEVHLLSDADVREGDTISIDGQTTEYEVRELETPRDPASGDAVATIATVERSD